MSRIEVNHGERQAKPPAPLRRIGRMLLMNTALGMVPALVAWWFVPGITWRVTGGNIFAGMLYAHSIGSLATFVMPRFWPWAMRRFGVAKWPILLAVFFGLTVLGCLIASGALLWLGFYQTASFWPYFVRGFKTSLLITFTLGAGLMAIETLQSRLNAATLALKTKELEREKALKLATEARLTSLESRIHPHFLFNVLNSISALIREDPARAERLIERMAALLRYSLDAGQSGLVRLEQELKIVRDYLEIEKARFDDRLRFSIDVPDEMMDLEVPPFAVQTLVENSIKHSIAKRREGGTIQVMAELSGGSCTLRVRDDGPGFRADELKTGHGLDLLQARLTALLGSGASLDLTRSEQGVVAISIPR